MQPAIEVGTLFGRLRTVERVTDGRWRCLCQRCGNDGVVASASALHGGRLRECWDCVQAAKKKRPQNVQPITSVKPSVARKDEHGWSIKEAA
jgi:hypothetical protein